MNKIYFALISLVGTATFTPGSAQVYGKNGMVVSENAIASKVGVEILKEGGNAIDAAVATAFALSVTFPQAGNIGGGGFLVYLDSTGYSTTVDFREKAPILATPDMFLDDNDQLINGSNHRGLKSVGVPGTVAGLYLAHQKYGVLQWKEVVQPSIDLCEKGIILSYTLSQQAEEICSGDSPEFLKNYFKNAEGDLIKFGEIWKQKELAGTLRIIRDKGKDGFYTGAVAEEIETYMKGNGGLITLEDLKKYEAIERTPVKGTYKEFEIIAMPPPCSGGVAIIEMLNIMEHANLDSIEFNSAQYVHIIAEAMRRAFADRAEYLGDPDFNFDMPLDKLTSKEFAKVRYDNIDFKRASVSDLTRFGQIYDGPSTTHISIIDKSGNSVSLTFSLEQSYGSGLGSPKLGFIFNNEMGDFNPQPGYTSSDGLIGTKPNLIEPEKRMLSSMSPTIITKDGRPYLIIGSPGGRTIISSVFQTILCVLDYDMPVNKAIEAMKVHHQWIPDQLVYEKNLLSPDTRKRLEAMGHILVERENIGRLCGITIDEKRKIYVGASDSSSPDGAAVGY